MSNITLKLKNFKQYSEQEFQSEGQMIAFIGDNGTGKSSAIQAIETALESKGFVKEPIKKGETEASIVFKAQRNDKEPIQVSIVIDGDNQYQFTASYIKDGKVKAISDPKKIRELIGVYYPLTVEEALSTTKFAEGRRKFINDYLLPLLGEEKKERLLTLQNDISEKKNKTTENNLYYTRRKKQEELTGIEGELKASVLSDEDKTIIASKDAVTNALNKLKEEKELHKEDGIRRKDIELHIEHIDSEYESAIKSLNNIQTKHSLSFINEITIMNSIINDTIEIYKKKLEGLYTSEQITALDEKITRGNNKLTEIATLEKRTVNTETKAKRDKVFNEINELNKKIEDAKTEIKTIYSNSSLPAGIQLDEDIITLNGFILDESTNSNTEVHIAIIELLCKLNTSGFINIGDWSVYGTEAKKKILTFAKKNNMIFMGQEVSEQSEVSLKTIIID